MLVQLELQKEQIWLGTVKWGVGGRVDGGGGGGGRSSEERV